jgi:subtilase family serine protease
MARRLLLFAFVSVLCALVPAAAMAKSHERVCGPPGHGEAACGAEVVTDGTGKPLATSSPTGYFPSDLRSAYALTATGSSAQTIAIVDAYDDPYAASDLNVYRSKFGIPACNTTGANPCFRKVNQTGGTKAPRANSGWSQEISLDLDMASAICPNCRILLVEANSSSLTDLGAAVNTAARLGATVISNSYGAPEFSSETSYESPYNHPGIPVTVSSGDNGYGVEFPAASRYVVAVGGTTLTRDSSARGFTETAWSGAGSGCSKYVPKPSWQTDTAGCANRTVADVSAIADPNTGVAVYDSYAYQGRSGWLQFGGTSVAAPIVASVYALAGDAAPVSNLWATGASLFDPSSGSNGSCGGSYLCTAGAGFDGPTGNGTPNGTSAF